MYTYLYRDKTSGVNVMVKKKLKQSRVESAKGEDYNFSLYSRKDLAPRLFSRLKLKTCYIDIFCLGEHEGTMMKKTWSTLEKFCLDFCFTASPLFVVPCCPQPLGVEYFTVIFPHLMKLS